MSGKNNTPDFLKTASPCETGVRFAMFERGGKNVKMSHVVSENHVKIKVELQLISVDSFWIFQFSPKCRNACCLKHPIA